MKITKELLEKTKCCKRGIAKFLLTPELQKDITATKIIVTNYNIFLDFSTFLNNAKVHIVDELKYIKNEDWESYTYSKGLRTKFENSGGFLETYEYNDRGLLSKTKYFDCEIICIYNSKDQLIKREYPNGDWTIYNYDDNGNAIGYERSNGDTFINPCNREDHVFDFKSMIGYDMSKITFVN